MKDIRTIGFYNNKAARFVVLLFVTLSVWRVVLYFYHPATDTINSWSFAWGASYQFIAIFGGIWGLVTCRFWGGRKSLLGRIILAFSIGLLLQAFGQSVYSYYVFTTGGALYPSLGDVGFFGSIFCYMYGVIAIARLVGARISQSSTAHKLTSLLLPGAMVAGSYFLFLSGYAYDWSHPLTVFLDFGYPLGQALYVSIAILSLIVIFSKQVLGGVLRSTIIFFLAALVMQFVSDFMFLYQASRGLYIAEGINDYMYLLSYFLMAMSLIRLEVTFEKIKGSN